MKYFDGLYFRWKIEGKVVTMQAAIIPCPGPTAFHEREKYLLNVLADWKKRGIEMIEFWSRDPTHAIKFHEKYGRKVEVLRTEKDGSFFCRLLL